MSKFKLTLLPQRGFLDESLPYLFLGAIYIVFLETPSRADIARPTECSHAEKHDRSGTGMLIAYVMKAFGGGDSARGRWEIHDVMSGSARELAFGAHCSEICFT